MLAHRPLSFAEKEWQELCQKPPKQQSSPQSQLFPWSRSLQTQQDGKTRQKKKMVTTSTDDDDNDEEPIIQKPAKSKSKKRNAVKKKNIGTTTTDDEDDKLTMKPVKQQRKASSRMTRKPPEKKSQPRPRNKDALARTTTSESQTNSVSCRNGTTEEHSRQNATRTERSVAHYDPVSGKITQVVTDVKVQSTTDTTTKINWQETLVKYKHEMAQIRELPVQIAQASSKAFLAYRAKIEREIEYLNKMCHLYEIKMNEVWTNREFVLRFLFGLPNSFDSKDCPLPNTSDPPYLACLWTMQEMLRFCNNTEFVCEYIGNFTQKEYYVNVDEEAPMFIVSSAMMSGYVTGVLLVEHLPVLKTLMREEVRSEQSRPYFPSFASYAGSVSTTFELCMRYDFHLCAQVHNLSVPDGRALLCEPQSKCNVIQEDQDCDGNLIRLLHDTTLMEMCFKAFEGLALMKPYSTENFDDSYSEVVAFQEARNQETPRIPLVPPLCLT